MWGAGQDAGSEACQEGFNEEVTFEFGTGGGNWGAVGEGTGQGSHFGGHCSLLETEKQGRKAQGSWGQESTCHSYIPAFITQYPHTGLLNSLFIFSKKRNSRNT